MCWTINLFYCSDNGLHTVSVKEKFCKVKMVKGNYKNTSGASSFSVCAIPKKNVYSMARNTVSVARSSMTLGV